MAAKKSSGLRELKRTAVHEAAHAVAQIALGLGCKHVTILADADSAGAAFHSGKHPTGERAADDYWRRQATQCYAGAEAQRRHGMRFWRTGTADDYHNARRALDMVTYDSVESRRESNVAKRRARELVAQHWPEVRAVAARLLRARRLSGAEARRIIRASLKARRGALLRW